MSLYPMIVTTLGTLAVIAFVGAVGFGAALAVPATRARLISSMDGQERHPMTWAWMVSLIAMSGSLYLSEIADLLPCSLCWYQRIAMYPLVLVLGVALLRRDGAAWRYGLPLSLVGLVISTYHVTIQWRPTLDLGTCNTGAPCTGRYLAVFGFVSIPTMAGAAFLLISVLLLLVRALDRRA